jgi:hypothetical protein
MMRILLDAKDLINIVEHSKPLRLSEFNTWLREHNSRLVYSLGNVRGLGGPIGLDDTQVPRIMEYIDRLEGLPHCYISSEVDLLELRSALHGYERGTEYEPIDPYVPRFDFVFPRFANPTRLNYPMRDIVYDLWKACPSVFKPQPKFHKIQALALSIDREQSGIRRKPPLSPTEPIVEVLMLKMSVSETRATEVASWISAARTRCPALWLARAIGWAMSENRTYVARKDDTFDMAEMYYIPYIDAATVDRAMLDWFSRAQRKLQLNGDVAKQIPKVFRSLADLMAASG